MSKSLSKQVNIEASAGDVLTGASEIALFLLGDTKARRKIYHLADQNTAAKRLPVFRLGNTICARKSTLLEWIAAQEKAVAP